MIQLKLFEVPEHARFVTSFAGPEIESFRVQQSIIPGVVLLHSTKHEWHVDFGFEHFDKDGSYINTTRRY